MADPTQSNSPKGRIIFSSKTRRLATIITALFTLTVLGYLISTQWDVLINYHWQFRPIPIIGSFLLFTGIQFLVAIIWGSIMNKLGNTQTFLTHIQYYAISNFAKRLPGTIWYVASRAHYYRQDGVDIKFTTLASGMEFVIAILAGIIVSLTFALRIISQYKISPVLILIAVLLGIVLIQPKVIDWLASKFKVETSLFKYRDILIWLIGYIIAWIGGGVLLFVIGNIITPISTSQLGYFIGSWSLVGVLAYMLIFSPSNFGISEIGLSLLLSQIMPVSIAVLIAIVNRIIIIVYEMGWAALFISLRSRKNQ
jgi:glycosyltransferase 2 family protein